MKLNRLKKLGGIVGIVLLTNICCNRCDTDQKYFSIIDMFIRNVELKTDGSHSFVDIPDSKEIDYQSFCIMLTLGIEYLSDNNSWSNPFLTPVYGCDAPPPLPNEKIEDIALTCYADFLLENGDTIYAGQRLNNFFNIEGDGMASKSLQDFLNVNPSPIEEPVFLYLNSPPIDNQSHRFSVKYKLTSGMKFQASTSSIILRQ